MSRSDIMWPCWWPLPSCYRWSGPKWPRSLNFYVADGCLSLCVSKTQADLGCVFITVGGRWPQMGPWYQHSTMGSFCGLCLLYGDASCSYHQVVYLSLSWSEFCFPPTQVWSELTWFTTRQHPPQPLLVNLCALSLREIPDCLLIRIGLAQE